MGDCMSKIKIQGNASGTGVVTLTAPATSTDKTITLPDTTATLVGSDTAVVKDASGNVGIGVTPKAWHSSEWALQVGGRGALHATVSQQTNLSTNVYANASNVWTAIATDEATMYQQDATGQHVFFVAGSTTSDTAISWTTAMTIQNDGYCSFDFDILRGATTPGAGNSAVYGKYGITHNSTHSTRTPFDIQYNGSTVGSITRSTSSVAYNTSSDYRLKENVVPMSGSIDRLKELKPSRFNFIADADTTVDGFLAHEAGEVVPECVSGEKDAMKTEKYEVTPAVMDGETVITEAVMGEREVPDMQGIDQSKLVPLLVGAIQELTARLESLEAN
jgi:hypothetical protein